MGDPQKTSESLLLLSRLYREKRRGLLSLETPDGPLQMLVCDGLIAALGPAEPPSACPPLPGPHDSATMRLDQILVELGIRPAPKPPPPPALAPPAGVRDRVVEALADSSVTSTFEEGEAAPPDLAQVAWPTEPFILDAVRRLSDGESVRRQLGDLDQRLECTAALSEERTLTLLEGYLLSRIDGTASARQVLQLVPLDSDEAERSLLGLVLTGRVELRPAPAPRAPWRPETPPPVAFSSPPAAAEPPPPADGRPAPEAEAARPLDPAVLEARREILEIFQALPLKNHFEVLGVEPGCSDADVKRGYTALAKRFHPDVHRDTQLADLRDVLEAIFIRIGEAWEVLGDAKSRASYEARSGVVRRPGEPAARLPSPLSATGSSPPPSPLPSALPPSADGYVTSEETLLRAQLLMLQANYWEAITLLEAAVPRMEPPRHQTRGRILLARAYAKNPNWLRKAEEQLQEVLKTDPVHVDASFQLGMLYKAQGLSARAQGLFRRVLELKPDHRDAAAELASLGPQAGGLLRRIFRRGKAS